MKLYRRFLFLLPSSALTPALALIGSPVSAAPCSDVDAPRAIYGAGGSAVTATLGNVATAVARLPEDERLVIFYSDPGACTGYAYFRAPDAALEISFRYWDEDGVEYTCEAPQSVVQFAHMGNTPALCPGDAELPANAASFVAPIQTTNFITHYDSQYDEISAEAIYHIFGFGPGASGRAVAPWVVPEATYSRNTSSFVHQIIAGSVGVPAAAFKSPQENVLATNGETVSAVYSWGQNTDPDQPLGYVSGSAAQAGEDNEQVKTLAYQHLDQSCAYLPDSSRQRRDKRNVRSGQYWVWTPAWFYSHVDGSGNPVDEDVGRLIGWFDGTLDPPGDVDIQQIVVESGDIPLCAMQALRPEGDLNAIVSYAPPNPCNGWYESVATGTTDYQSCDDSSDCDGAGEACRFGYCEAY